MQRVSTQYKEIMKRNIRNRAYVSVGIGIVNNEAQKDGVFNGDFAYWSNEKPTFDNTTYDGEYATLEQDFFKADGSMHFLPENNEYAQLLNKGLVTENILGSATVKLGKTYDIKGLTVDFGEAYPTELTITTDNGSYSYTNDGKQFVTTDTFGEITYITITPLSMIGGNQRMRIKTILMGVGLNYSNADVKSVSLKDHVSLISDDLPMTDLSIKIFNYEDVYNVDNDNSFVNYLNAMQQVTISFGLELDDGSVEWVKCRELFLKDWKSTKGQMSFTATDRFDHMKDKYSLGNKIYARTAYDEAISVLTDAGLEPDEYFVDESLQDITLTNPMPVLNHKEALQLIANVGRCVLRQDTDGRIVFKPNFANVIEPTDIVITSDDEADWSKIENVLVGSEYVYADLTQGFFKVDSGMYFLPANGDYSLDTGYVSGSISDENGLFEANPTLAITIPAAHSYYGIHCNFDGNPPTELIIHTYLGDTLLESVTFTNIEKENVFNHDFLAFDTMVFEFVKTMPYNRILVNKIAFGNMSDYRLTKNDMLKSPQGYKEELTKSVAVKIYTFENDESGVPQEVEDSVFVTNEINLNGNKVVWENPLVSTQAQAELLSEWLGAYYANNITYNVQYRGEPRLNASDVIYMDSDILNNLQVEVESSELTFNGAFAGKLGLRRALQINDSSDESELLIVAYDDDNGNVTLENATVTDDESGGVMLLNATAVDDGNGDVTLTNAITADGESGTEQMKSMTVGGKTYKVVDETAREQQDIDYTQIEFDTEEIVVADPQEAESSVVADKYSESVEYAVGDYCIFNDVLYKCTTTTSGAFDASCWTSTTVGAEISEVNSNIIHRKTVSRTISSGNINLELPSDKYVVLSVYNSSTSWIFTPFVASSGKNWYAHINKSDGTEIDSTDTIEVNVCYINA